MRLDTEDLHQLAAFFAKRFPTPSDRRTLAHEAGVRPDRDPMASPEDAWLALLGNADDQGRTRLLAHAIARRAPADGNLVGVCQVLTGSQTPGIIPMVDRPFVVPALAASAVALLGLAAYVGVGHRDAATAASVSDVQVAASRAVVAPPAAAPALVAVEDPTPARPADRPWMAGNPLDAATGTSADAPPKAKPAQVPPEPAHFNGRCTVEGGGIVGYWYAGRTAPAAAGETLVMPNSVNVRADYPDKHNRFDARTALRCTLSVGDKVRLTAEPIAVPGGAFWVPLHSGDLILD
ncbi:MAG: effector-associated domain EAD1-containing protein [Myxococcota bacterium]|nr:effector-associated domain EAD1-containing protein [Myxococcota bacterium]